MSISPHLTYANLLRQKGFLPYLLAEFFSAFSDNLLKFVLLFTATAIFEKQSAHYIALISATFILPYLLFLGYAGYLSDRFSKRAIFIYVKAAEIGLTIFALITMLIGDFNLMLLSLFFMMIRSCIFFPAKVGLLPELLEKKHISMANSLLWMSVFVAAILGAILGGVLYQLFADKIYMTGVILIAISVVGFYVSRLIPKVNFTPTDSPFPINPWRDIIQSTKTIVRRKSVLVAILGIGWFWFMAALVQNILPLYGKQVLKVDETFTSLLQGFVGIGIAIGCTLAGAISRENNEPGLIPFGAIGVATGTFLASSMSASYTFSCIAFFIIGVSGGVFVIPIYTFLHHRAKGNERGRIFATANYVDTLGMMVAAGMYWVLGALFDFTGDIILLFFGFSTVFVTIYALKKLPVFFLRAFNLFLMKIFYTIDVKGLENIPDKGGALLVPNHVSYIDGLILWYACRKRNISFMIYHKIFELKSLNWLFSVLRYIPVYGGKRVKESIEIAQNRLIRGDVICIFPEGEITRTGNFLPFRRGMERVVESIKERDIPVIPVYMDKIWGSIFSYNKEKFFFKWPQRNQRRLSITIGEPLSLESTALSVRERVITLGAEAISNRKKNDDILPIHLIKQAKRNWFSFCITNPQSPSLTFGEFISKSIKLTQILKVQIPYGSNRIGVNYPPSVEGALIHSALALLGKSVVCLSDISNSNLTHIISNKPLKTLNSNVICLNSESFKLNLIEHIKYTILSYTLSAKTLVRKYMGNQTIADDTAVEFSDVSLSHYNIIMNSDSLSQLLFLKDEDRTLSAYPYFSHLGLIGQSWFPLINGVGVVCTNSTKEQPVSKIHSLIKTHKVSIIMMTEQFYKDSLKLEQYPNTRVSLLAGTKHSDEIYIEMKEKFDTDVFEGLIAPETTLFMCVNHQNYVKGNLKQVAQKQGSFGQCIPGMVAKICNKEGVQLPPNEEGTLHIKGASLAKSLTLIDDWFNTNKIAFIDEDGFIHLAE